MSALAPEIRAIVEAMSPCELHDFEIIGGRIPVTRMADMNRYRKRIGYDQPASDKPNEQRRVNRLRKAVRNGTA